MSKRRRTTKLPPFVPLYNSTRASPAWKALSYGARCTYVELRAFYSLQKENAVRLSCRDGAKALGTKNVTRVAEWIRELQCAGAADFRLAQCEFWWRQGSASNRLLRLRGALTVKLPCTGEPPTSG